MITVLMPTYNCEEFIDDAIRSILNQTYKNFEFLIIDDGSIDSTESKVSNIKDERIRYIKRNHSGFADSLNFGLQNATFDLIARMDSDDLAHPHRLEKQLALFFKEKVKYKIIGSWYAVFNKKEINYIVRTPENHEEIRKSLSLYSTIPHSGCIYNRNAIIENTLHEGNAFEDYSLWLKLKDRVTFYNIPEVLTFVRYRKESLSRGDLTKKKTMIYNIQVPYFIDLKKNFSIITDSEVNKITGWREYFYGSKSQARKIWLSRSSNFFFDYRICLALLLTFLPEKTFQKFKESRMRFRIAYMFAYYRSENREMRKLFTTLL